MKQQIHKFSTIILLLYVLGSGNFLYAQNFEWVKNAGGKALDAPCTVSLDHLGNVYSIGIFTDSVDFDPGPGVHTVYGPHIGYGTGVPDPFTNDIYILKMGEDGSFGWVRTLSGSKIGRISMPTSDLYSFYPEWIANDASGNSYIVGGFQGTVDFDPGPEVKTLTSTVSNDLSEAQFFLLKLDINGNFVWVKNIGPGGIGASIFVNNTGVYVSGAFNYHGDFDPGPGILDITTVPPYRGAGWNLALNPFISKLDTAGNLIWVKTFPGKDRPWDNYQYTFVNVNGVCADREGNVYTTGYFNDTMDFDPSSGGVHYAYPNARDSVSSGGTNVDAFLVKLDPQGNFVWVRRIGNQGLNYPTDLVVDKGGKNIYLGVSFVDVLDERVGVDGEAQDSLIAPGGAVSNAAIIKLDALSGNSIWVRSVSGYSIRGVLEYAYPTCLALDDRDNLYFAGLFSGKLDSDPSPVVEELTTIGDTANSFGYGAGDNSFVCKWNPSGKFVWAKSFGYDTLLLWATSVTDLTVTGNGDVFTVGTFGGLDNTPRAGESVGIEFNPGPGSFRVQPRSGYDVYVHKMSQCMKESNPEIVICDSFSLNNKKYTASGTYLDTLYNAGREGCDSVVTLKLTIGTTTIANIAEVACDSFRWNGQVYSLNGNYIQSFRTNEGCDSVVTLALTVHHTPDLSVTKTGTTLTANGIGRYQWIDCDHQQIIPGETDASYTPAVNGSYAVIITGDEGCSDTSDCLQIGAAGVNETNANAINVYPNPTNSSVIVTSGIPMKAATMRLLSVTGQVMMETTNLNGSTFRFNIEKYASGTYFMEFRERDYTTRIRIVKD